MSDPLEKSIDRYRQAVRSAIRGLWAGAFTRSEFEMEMRAAVEGGVERAWFEGAAQCGIHPEELTIEERAALLRFTDQQLVYVGGLADAVERNSRAEGGKLTPLLGRGDLWVNRYNQAVSMAKMSACGDLKYRWIVGPTEHCTDCAMYNGRVYRGSVWASVGAQPQASALACHGFRCQCILQQTTDAAMPGRPPAPRG